MRCDRLVIHTFAVEAIALSMLFMMWLVGTAIATVSIPLYAAPSSCADPQPYRPCGVIWAGATNTRHAVCFPHSWGLRGPAGSLCSSYSVLVLFTRSSIERGPSLYMGTSIPATVSYLPKPPSIARAGFEPLPYPGTGTNFCIYKF